MAILKLDRVHVHGIVCRILISATFDLRWTLQSIIYYTIEESILLYYREYYTIEAKSSQPACFEPMMSCPQVDFGMSTRTGVSA